jgi:hypothetical protein
VEDNNQSAPQQTVQQPNQDNPKGLLPGQEHEDELDYMGGALFGLAKSGFKWIKQFFAAKQL